MEKKVNKRIDAYMSTFKNDVRQKAYELNIINNQEVTQLLQFVYDYHRLIFKKEDFMKRKRNKLGIEMQCRCIAKRSNGEQCTRRKKNDTDYCGTHLKGTPHGICDIVIEQTEENINEIEVRVQDVNGIMYFIDLNNNVYETEEVLMKKRNPKIIGKYINNLNGESEIIYLDKLYS